MELQHEHIEGAQPFSNHQIDIHTLPSVGEVDMKPLDKKYLNVEISWAVLISLFFLIVPGIILLVNPMDVTAQWRGLIYLLPLSIAIALPILAYFSFKKKKYAVREKDVIYESGLIWRDYIVVPYHRIQHVDVQQGPVERMFGLANVNVYTAGGSSSDVSIPGLTFDAAQSLKHFILRQSSGDEEE